MCAASGAPGAGERRIRGEPSGDEGEGVIEGVDVVDVVDAKGDGRVDGGRCENGSLALDDPDAREASELIVRFEDMASAR